jgi:polyribonucleotide nucleotidyltransferase
MKEKAMVRAYEMKLQCGADGEPGCGREITGAGAYANHRRKCPDALGQAKVGRTESADRTPPAARTERKKRTSRVPRKPRTMVPPKKQKRVVVPKRMAARRTVRRAKVDVVVAPVTPAQMIAALRAERAKIDAAIASIEALA